VTPTRGSLRRGVSAARGDLADTRLPPIADRVPEDPVRGNDASAWASPTIVATGRHVPALDGTRGIAIILVMAFHLWRAPVTALGWSGVDLFFVLSGYLITGILWDSRLEPDRARSFYIRRALRILPLYYGVLIAVFVVRPVFGWAHRLDDLALAHEQVWYWTYLCDWRIALNHPPAFTFLTHFWTLSIEEQFYLVWPLIIWRCARRTSLAIAGAVAVGALLLRIAVVVATATPEAAYALFPCRLDALAVGAILALGIRGPDGVRAMRRWVIPAALSGATVVCALVLFRPSVRFADPGMMTIGYTAIDWMFAGLVLTAATTRSRFLESAPLRAAGRYSYGLYVYHPIVMWWIVRHVPILEASQWGSAIGGAAASVALAYASYHLYESRFLRLKDRLAPRNGAARLSAARA
jgi:peptidoglycan/LPS O-acetylase OafA/YrhL